MINPRTWDANAYASQVRASSPRRAPGQAGKYWRIYAFNIELEKIRALMGSSDLEAVWQERCRMLST
jgi:hypothetical protein